MSETSLADLADRQAQTPSGRDVQVQHGSGARSQGPRCRRALYGSTGAGHRAVGR
jgi:hypothetical protein